MLYVSLIYAGKFYRLGALHDKRPVSVRRLRDGCTLLDTPRKLVDCTWVGAVHEVSVSPLAAVLYKYGTSIVSNVHGQQRLVNSSFASRYEGQFGCLVTCLAKQ
jgi:hypothetical protein